MFWRTSAEGSQTPCRMDGPRLVQSLEEAVAKLVHSRKGSVRSKFDSVRSTLRRGSDTVSKLRQLSLRKMARRSLDDSTSSSEEHTEKTALLAGSLRSNTTTRTTTSSRTEEGDTGPIKKPGKVREFLTEAFLGMAPAYTSQAMDSQTLFLVSFHYPTCCILPI